MSDVEDVLYLLIIEAECQAVPDMPKLLEWLDKQGYKIVRSETP